MASKKWRVLYQDVPYNYTDPKVLVVQGDTRAAAVAQAWQQLTVAGRAVHMSNFELRGILSDLELAELSATGTSTYSEGKTHIRSVDVMPHTETPAEGLPPMPVDWSQTVISKEMAQRYLSHAAECLDYVSKCLPRSEQPGPWWADVLSSAQRLILAIHGWTTNSGWKEDA